MSRVLPHPWCAGPGKPDSAPDSGVLRDGQVQGARIARGESSVRNKDAYSPHSRLGVPGALASKSCGGRCTTMNAAVAISLLALVASALPADSAVKWFTFNKTFIAAHYSGGEAFGAVSSTGWSPAASAHGVSCGGSDGELHIGSLNGALTLGSGESP